jgi:hypothetical protein
MVPSSIVMFEATLAPVRERLVSAGVRRIGIFGSVARNQATENSDVDVLIEFLPENRTLDNLDAVGQALEEAFHSRVDLVTEDSLSPYLAPRILSEVKYVDLGC